MSPRSSLRALLPEELKQSSHSPTPGPLRRGSFERATIILAHDDGLGPSAIARKLGVSRPTVYTWVKRFNAQGPDGLLGQPRSGRPATYPPEQVAEVIAASMTDPKELGLPFGSWTLDRLQAYLNEKKKIPIRRSRISVLFRSSGSLFPQGALQFLSCSVF